MLKVQSASQHVHLCILADVHVELAWPYQATRAHPAHEMGQASHMLCKQALAQPTRRA